MKVLLISFYFILLLLGACKSITAEEEKNGPVENTTSKIPMIIDIARDFNNEKEFRLSEIAYDIEYIKLEATPGSLIGSGHKTILVTDSSIFIYNQNRLLHFDRDGKFIKQIGREGRGPGEVQGIRNMAMDKENGLIYILANFKNEVLGYDAISGEFITNFPNSDYLGTSMLEGAFQVIEPGVFTALSHIMTRFQSEFVMLEIFDENGNILDKKKSHIYSYQDDEKREKRHYNVHHQTWIFENQLRLFEGENDTIYRLSNMKLEPYYIFELGRFKGPLDLMVSADRGRIRYVSLAFFRETNTALFFSIRYDDKRIISKYNKDDGQFHRLVNPHGEHNRIYNDLDGGLSFWPYYTSGAMEDEWFMMVDAIIMKQNLTPDYMETSEAIFLDKKEHLEGFLEELTIEDNPVLMIVKLK